MKNEISNLVKTILETRQLLKHLELDMMTEAETLEQVLVSYREGWISLSEFLNTIEIYHNFIQSHAEQLTKYSRAIFKWEMLTGKSLIQK